MRITIWQSVNSITTSSDKYKLTVTMYGEIGFGYVSCLAYDEGNYLAIPYSIWLVKDVFLPKLICQYRSEHIDLRVIGSDAQASYHWSFKQWQFIDTAKEIQEKIHE